MDQFVDKSGSDSPYHLTPSPAFSENIPSMAVSRNPGELGTVSYAFLYHHSPGNQRDFIKEKG
jgi:hypothetical protein